MGGGILQPNVSHHYLWNYEEEKKISLAVFCFGSKCSVRFKFFCIAYTCVVGWGIKFKLVKFDEKNVGLNFVLFTLVWNNFGLFWISFVMCM